MGSKGGEFADIVSSWVRDGVTTTVLILGRESSRPLPRREGVKQIIRGAASQLVMSL
jgi:hypothetical protein